MLQAGLPFLEIVAALLVLVAVFTLAIAALHIILAVRSSDLHRQSCSIRRNAGAVDNSTVTKHGILAAGNLHLI